MAVLQCDLHTTVVQAINFVDTALPANLEAEDSRPLARIPKYYLRRVGKYVVHETDGRILYLSRESETATFVIMPYLMPKLWWFPWLPSRLPFARVAVRLEARGSEETVLSVLSYQEAARSGFFTSQVAELFPRRRRKRSVLILLTVLILAGSVFFIFLLILLVLPLGLVALETLSNRRKQKYLNETIGLIAGHFASRFNHDSSLLQTHRVSSRRWKLRAVGHILLDFLSTGPAPD